MTASWPKTGCERSFSCSSPSRVYYLLSPCSRIRSRVLLALPAPNLFIPKEHDSKKKNERRTLFLFCLSIFCLFFFVFFFCLFFCLSLFFVFLFLFVC